MKVLHLIASHLVLKVFYRLNIRDKCVYFRLRHLLYNSKVYIYMMFKECVVFTLGLMEKSRHLIRVPA
jgi:hypothetical protein